MNYLIKGNLSVWLCKECKDPLAGITINVYRNFRKIKPVQVSEKRSKDKFKIISGRELLRMNKLGEGNTDAAGNFSIELSPEYQGGIVELTVRCDTVPGLNFKDEQWQPVEFTLATFDPAWSPGNDCFQAYIENTISCKFWCHVLSLFNVKVICGKIVSSQNPSIPVAGAEITAFNSKWIANNTLGAAVTNSHGYFNIYCSGGYPAIHNSNQMNNPQLSEVSFDVKSWGVWYSLMKTYDSKNDANLPLSALVFVIPFQRNHEAVA